MDESFYESGVGYGGWGLWIQNGHTLFSDGEFYNELVDTGPAMVSPGEWAYVAVVYHYNDPSANNFIGDFYVNTFLNSYPIASSTKNWNPGSYATLQLGNLGTNDSLGAGTYTFNRSMHDVAIYNVALSPSEIQSNFFATQFLTNSPAPVPDLIEYKMTEANTANNSNQTFIDRLDPRRHNWHAFRGRKHRVDEWCFGNP